MYVLHRVFVASENFLPEPCLINYETFTIWKNSWRTKHFSDKKTSKLLIYRKLFG